MGEPLPLFPGAQPCVMSGYCCRVAACPFGTWDEDRHQCAQLTEDDRCGRYDEILALPRERWAGSPAFGAGCSSTLGNERRARILANDPDLRARIRAGRAVPQP